MTLIEAAKLAREAILQIAGAMPFPVGQKAITALDQAIAEAEQQEPVALAKELDGVIADVEEGDGFDDVCLDTVKYVRDQLAASPKREWQGLTDKELDDLWVIHHDYLGHPKTSAQNGWAFERAIEAKLKEKNT